MTTLDVTTLFAPLSFTDFVKRHWERRSLYAPGPSERFDGLFDRERLLEVARRPRGAHSGDPRRLKAGFRDQRGEHAELSITASQVEPLLAANMTVQAEWVHETDPGVAAFVDDVRRSLAVPVELDVAAFLSPPGSGYGLHFDTTSMFVLQLAGTKRWHYAPTPAVPRPVSNVIPDAAARDARIHGYDESSLLVQELSPGDVLYLPAGAWHHVKATSESLHVCLTLRPVNVLDLARDLLLDDLLSEVRGRSLPERPGPHPSDPTGRARTEAWFAARLDALRKAVERLSPAALADAWSARSEAEGDEAAPVPRDARLSHAMPVAWRRAEGPDGDELLQVMDGDAVLATLSAQAEGFLEGLRASERFAAKDAAAWAPELAWDDVAMLLGELVALGVLRRA